MRGLFHHDARYEIIDGSTFIGIDEIVQYWLENRNVQRGVATTLISHAGYVSGAVAHWKADFFRTDLASGYRVEGLLWITVKEGKIDRLVECYRSSVVPETKVPG